MHDSTYFAAYFITNIFLLVSIHRCMHTFFEERRTNRIICVGAYLLYFFSTSLFYLLFDIPVLTLSINFIALFLISLTYSTDIRKCILCAAFTLLFMLIPEVLVGAFTDYFRFSVFNKGSYSSAVGLIMMRILTYMLAQIVFHIRILRKSQTVSILEWGATFAVPIFTITLQSIIAGGDVSKGWFIASAIMILALNVVTFYLYDSLSRNYIKQKEHALLKQENELYSKQCRMMEESTKELQIFRHDLKNRMLGICRYLDAGQLSEADDAIRELSGVMEKNTLRSVTGNLAVDSIINYKLQAAILNDADVKTDIAVPAELEMNVADLSILIGNLVDNALEALQMVPSDQRSLYLKVVVSHNRLILQITNPYVQEVKYENGEIISSKPDSDKHGLGLKSVKRIVEKYEGGIVIHHENHLFSVDALLYLSTL